MYNFYKGKKILITGNTGFKGSWLSIWLHKMGANVVGYSLEPPTQPSLYDICNLKDKIHTIIGDVRNHRLLTDTINVVRPEIIFHMAAQPLVRKSYIDPVNTYETNVMGTVNLFDAIRLNDCVRAVVNITTDKCYYNTESYTGYREEDRLGGFDPYSSSKACCEFVTEAYRNSFFNITEYDKHGVAIATARAGNVIGGGDFAEDRLVPDCIKAITNNESILIRNPDPVRPWQHVLEPLSGYLLLGERLYNHGVEHSGAWNFGPSEQNDKTVDYIVKRICHLWNKNELYTTNLVSQPHETTYLRLDSSKACQKLQFKPKWDIDKSLEMVYAWTNMYLEGNNMYQHTLVQIDDYVMDK